MNDSVSGVDQTRAKEITSHFHYAMDEQTHLRFKYLFHAMEVVGEYIEGQPGDQGADCDQHRNSTPHYVFADYGTRLLAECEGVSPRKDV